MAKAHYSPGIFLYYCRFINNADMRRSSSPPVLLAIAINQKWMNIIILNYQTQMLPGDQLSI